MTIPGRLQVRVSVAWLYSNAGFLSRQHRQASSQIRRTIPPRHETGTSTFLSADGAPIDIGACHYQLRAATGANIVKPSVPQTPPRYGCTSHCPCRQRARNSPRSGSAETAARATSNNRYADGRGNSCYRTSINPVYQFSLTRYTLSGNQVSARPPLHDPVVDRRLAATKAPRQLRLRYALIQVVLRWSWFVGQSEGENKVYSDWF